MADFRDVDRNISKLENMMPGSWVDLKPDWKALWHQIKATSQSFKGAKFPTRDDHEAAWNRFQKLVDQVKEKQADVHTQWEMRRNSSVSLRKKIISQAIEARPIDSGLSRMMLTIGTGGFNLLIDAIMGPFDEEKELLLSCSTQLRIGWDTLKEYKDEMLGGDKSAAFEELRKTQDILDRRWEIYKQDRKRAYELYQSNKVEKRQRWVEKLEKNILDLKDRKKRLDGVVAHKREHLGELYEKLRDAWSDDYKQRVQGWINEEEASIADIQEKIRDLNTWIDEEIGKLNS